MVQINSLYFYRHHKRTFHFKYSIKSATKVQESFQISSRRPLYSRLEYPKKKSPHSSQLVGQLLLGAKIFFIARSRASKIHKSRRNVRSWWRRNHVKRPEYVELNRRKRREADIKSKEGLGG